MTNRSLLSILDLSNYDIERIFDLALSYLHDSEYGSNILKNKIVVNLFFENSTRTLISFEIAEKTLGAHSITLPLALSSIKKGESINDTILTLNSMNPDFIVIRTKDTFSLKTIGKLIPCGIINAGDGMNEHPTQSLINCFTILYFKNKIEGLNIVICGDIKHSRVARSDIRILNKLNANIKLVAPPTLISSNSTNFNDCSYEFSDEIICNADVIMLLRIQKERLGNELQSIIPSEREYASLYCLNEERLLKAKKDVLILHPGPINRNTEIESKVADNRSSILFQVKVGVAIRKALFHYFT